MISDDVVATLFTVLAAVERTVTTVVAVSFGAIVARDVVGFLDVTSTVSNKLVAAGVSACLRVAETVMAFTVRAGVVVDFRIRLFVAEVIEELVVMDWTPTDGGIRLYLHTYGSFLEHVFFCHLLLFSIVTQSPLPREEDHR
jgi:hypothetical protein